MEREPIPTEIDQNLDAEQESSKLPEAEAFPIGGRQEAVICPFCGNMEHAPAVGEPEQVKNCEYFEKFNNVEPKKYKVKKAA